MGYLRVYLDDSDVLSRIIECVPVIDIQRNPIFETSKRKHEKSRFLASLLLNSVTRRDLEAGAGESFSSRWLTKGLGRDYKKYLEPLYLFAGENLGYSVTARTTKRYRMRPGVRTKVREAIRSYDGPERIVDHNGKPVGERRLRGNGNQCKTSEIVPTVFLRLASFSANTRCSFPNNSNATAHSILRYCGIFVNTLCSLFPCRFSSPSLSTSTCVNAASIRAPALIKKDQSSAVRSDSMNSAGNPSSLQDSLNQS